MRKKDLAKQLGHEFEIEQYIHALGSSSTQVRFVMLAIIVAIIAAATTLWSSKEESWEKARITRFYEEYNKAQANNIWKRPQFDPDACAGYTKRRKEEEKRDEKTTSFLGKVWQIMSERTTMNTEQKGTVPERSTQNAKEQRSSTGDANNASATGPEEDSLSLRSYRNLTADQLCEVFTYFKSRGITNDEEAKLYVEKLYEAYVNNMLYIQVPVLGIIFDVNDLGLVTGVTFFILMLVMSFYTHRAHENLAVCMWKVHEIAEKEQCFDVPGGKPNLLYHALAMQQVFTIPPTLARWRDNWVFRYFHYLLFILPFATALLVTYHDFDTVHIGKEYSTAQTELSLRRQVILLCLILFLCILCCAHLYADDVLWRRIFLFINPAHRFKGKARWIHWTHLAHNVTPSWGLIGVKHAIYVNDTVREAVWKVTQESIVYHEKAYGKGLRLRQGEVQQYSLKPRNFPKFKRGLWWYQFWERPLTWSGNPRIRSDSSSEEIIGLRDDNDRLEVWERRLERNCLPITSTWRLGGAEQQADGTGKEVGFQDIRAIVAVGKELFLTDGAWLRRIDENGIVTTWGGQPLAHVVRREPPLLLGLHYVGGMDITPERTLESAVDFKPEILVCDFSTRRVFGVVQHAAAEVYRSKWGWTPSGVYVEGNNIYLLEYRRGFVWNEQVTSWQTTSALIGHLFRLRNYARVIRFPRLSFSSKPEVLFQISPQTARSAKNEKERALQSRRSASGIRNYSWGTPWFVSRISDGLDPVLLNIFSRFFLNRRTYD